MTSAQPLCVLTLDLDTAQRLVSAAVAEANRRGLRIHAWAVDHAGEPLAYLRMPGAPLPARLFAEKKAYTAANFGHATATWKAKLAHKPFVAQGLAEHPCVALFGGGVPVVVEGTVVGAIGIAGALEEQDEEIAAAALEAVGA